MAGETIERAAPRRSPSFLREVTSNPEDASIVTAIVLMGKHRPDYTPHVDCSDFVVVTNATKVGLTGRKAEQRMKQRYTEYPGGLKMESYGSVRQRKPEKLVQDAVRRMMPKNRMSRMVLKNLMVYPGAEHPHADKNPVAIKI